MLVRSRTRRLGLMFVLSTAIIGCSDAHQETVNDTDAEGGTAAWRGPPVSSSDAPPGRWHSDPEDRWRLEEDVRIGVAEGAAPYVFGHVRNVIPAEGGGVWVYDQQAAELRGFDRDGTHLLSVGRQGQGPGEFSGNACALKGVDDEIWVETETSWHRFSPAGELLGTFPPPTSLTCGVKAWMSAREYLVSSVRFDRATRTPTSFFITLRWDTADFSPLDTLAGPRVDDPRTVTFVNSTGRGRSERLIPFVHHPGLRLQSQGSFLVWDGGGDYSIRLESAHGDTLREIARPYVPVAVDSEAKREAMDDFARPGWQPESDFDPSEVPEVYPPFSSAVLSEDGSIWVRRTVEEGRTAWDIFSPSGEYLGELAVPESLSGLSIRSVGVDHVWGILRDEYGIEVVVRARLVNWRSY